MTMVIPCLLDFFFPASSTDDCDTLNLRVHVHKSVKTLRVGWCRLGRGLAVLKHTPCRHRVSEAPFHAECRPIAYFNIDKRCCQS